jgi:recombinational DNA repair ATPase RecF
MRLHSLTVRNYRVHKEVTVEFDRARTVIGGPNESGKSTLAEAAHRVLFLRAKTGGLLQKEMQSSVHPGDPEVQLVFECGGVKWELEKRFGGNARGSTQLRAAGGVALKDAEAETKLGELLGVETAGGGGAAGQLAQLWSHLWVWQGRSWEEPSKHTGPHRDRLVRHLQESGAGAVLQSSNDQRVAGLVGEAYEEVYTPTGKMKAGSKPELARVKVEEAAAVVVRAREAAERLGRAVDDYGRAEREIAEIGARLPKLREDRAAVVVRLGDAERFRVEEMSLERSVKEAGVVRAGHEANDRVIREGLERLGLLAAELVPAEERLVALVAAEAAARGVAQAGEVAHREAGEAVRRARQGYDMASAAVVVFEKEEVLSGVAARAAEAAALHGQLEGLRLELAQLPAVAASELARLRRLEAESGQAVAALEAMATGVEVVEAVEAVRVDGVVLGVGETRILTETGELVVGDGTRVRIRPGGGNSLAEARGRAEAARLGLARALEALALRDVEHAGAVVERRQLLGHRMEGLEARWKTLGGEKVASELGRATAERDSARGEWGRRVELIGESGGVSVVEDLATARAMVEKAREVLGVAEGAEASALRQSERLRGQWDAAVAALSGHRDATAAARQNHRDLETSIRTLEEAHGEAGVRGAAIEAARASEGEAAARLEKVRGLLAGLQPEVLRADAERLERAIGAQEARLREAENLRLVAGDRLTLDGGTDPEAELRSAEARHAAASELLASEVRRAAAVKLLHELFSSSREAIDRALVAPLAERIGGYLRCVFGAETEVRVALTEGGIEQLELLRAGETAVPFVGLSGGAREQTAAAVRLALAEILAADFGGCLPVVFDDAFAYADPDRIESLQRMLDLAAVRGLQVIVLTCTPADYAGFGAREVRLAGR